MNKISLLLAYVSLLWARPLGEITGNFGSSGEALLPTPPSGPLSRVLRTLTEGLEGRGSKSRISDSN